jgi:hypothetical protein
MMDMEEEVHTSGRRCNRGHRFRVNTCLVGGRLPVPALARSTIPCLRSMSIASLEVTRCWRSLPDCLAAAPKLTISGAGAVCMVDMRAGHEHPSCVDGAI